MKQKNGQSFLNDLNLQTQPTSDEIELVVFGRGYGECIMFKYSNDEYMVIDSFLNPETKNPIAIDYLNALNFPAKCIKKVVVTHWHGDHIAGLSNIIKNASKDVKVILNPIINSEKFLEFLSLNEKQRNEGTKEFVQIFNFLSEKQNNVVLASNNKALYVSENINIRALSPQDSEVWNYISELNARFIKTGIGYDIPDNNELSIALLLKYDGKGILLGSDLENGEKPNTCWNGIIQDYSDVKSDIFKIPHHGSKNAYNDNVWKVMLEQFPTSILTTFNKSTKLPKEEDIKRILTLSKQLFIVGSKSKRNKDVERLVKNIRAKITISAIPQTIGMVRYRYNLVKKQSQFEWFGDVKIYNQ